MNLAASPVLCVRRNRVQDEVGPEAVHRLDGRVAGDARIPAKLLGEPGVQSVDWIFVGSGPSFGLPPTAAKEPHDLEVLAVDQPSQVARHQATLQSVDEPDQGLVLDYVDGALGCQTG